MADERQEGWYTDPYERHEARWMSAGRHTKLVRDGKVESYDAPRTRSRQRSLYGSSPSHPQALDCGIRRIKRRKPG